MVLCFSLCRDYNGETEKKRRNRKRTSIHSVSDLRPYYSLILEMVISLSAVGCKVWHFHSLAWWLEEMTWSW